MTLKELYCKIFGHNIVKTTLFQDGKQYIVFNGKTYIDGENIHLLCWHGTTFHTCGRCNHVIFGMDYNDVCRCKKSDKA